MLLKVGELFYIVCLLFSAIFVTLFGIIAYKKGNFWSKKVIKVFVWINFAIFFFKQFGPGFITNWPTELKKSTFENLNAALILLSPLLLYIDKNWSKDYLMIAGLLIGFISCIYPRSIIGVSLEHPDGIYSVLIFYITNTIMMTIGIIMLCGKYHKISYKRIGLMYLVFLVMQCIILTNEYVCFTTMLSKISNEQFFSRDIANGSMVFGPYSALDKNLGWAYKLIPSAFIKESSAGEMLFLPVVWMLVPSLFLMPLMFLITLPLTFKDFNKDCYIFRYSLSMKIQSLKASRSR